MPGRPPPSDLSWGSCFTGTCPHTSPLATELSALLRTGAGLYIGAGSYENTSELIDFINSHSVTYQAFADPVVYRRASPPTSRPS